MSNRPTREDTHRPVPPGQRVAELEAALDAERRRAEVAEAELRRSAAETDWLIARMPGAYVLWERVLGVGGRLVDLRFVHFNRAFTRVTGLALERTRGRTVREVWPTTEQDWFDAFGEVLATGVPRSFEMEHGPTGGAYWVHAYRPMTAPDRLCALFRDVTERNRSAEQIEQLGNLQRAILNAVSMGVAFVRARRYVWANPAFAAMFGLRLDEVAGMRTTELYADEADADRVGLDGYATIATGATYETEARMKRRDGSLLWCAITGQALDAHDVETGSIWVVHDVTARRESEESLRREQALNKAFFDSVPGLLYLYDENHRLVRWNKRFNELTGLSDAELAGKHVTEWLAGSPDEGQRMAAALRRLAQQGRAEVEVNIPSRAGTVLRYFFTAVSLQVEGWSGFVGVGIDATDYRRIERSARESQERLGLALAGADLGTWSLDVETGAAHFDERWTGMLGYTPAEVEPHLLGWSALVHPDDADAVRERLAAHVEGRTPHFEAEYRLRHKTGSWVWVLSRGKVIDRDAKGRALRVAGTHLDVTERRNAEEQRARLQEQLQQAMKMEAVGRLAGGVAHDFNNLLTAISGNLELARMDLPPEHPVAQNLDEAGAAAERATALTRQLLAFSRRQIIEPKVLNLNDLVGNLERMLARLIGEDIALQKVLAGDLRPVKVDPGQFEQVLVNLAVNARDAMPGGGRLQISTSNVELDAAYCAGRQDLAPGTYVLLAVSDTGHGMSPEVKERLFEPFFTTKPAGRGTGLGLATTFGTVKQAGGSIEVYSEVGFGTTFKIYLPAAEGEALDAEAGADRSEIVGGGETLLVVEDETSVRDLAVSMLRRLGYQVLCAGNPADALSEAAAHAGRIDLLLTDVVMPGMNGRELARRLLAIHPESRVLYTSGYTENVIVHHGVVENDIDFIGKPYTMQALAARIRAALERRAQ